MTSGPPPPVQYTMASSEADHSSSSAKFRNKWRSKSTSSYALKVLTNTYHIYPFNTISLVQTKIHYIRVQDFNCSNKHQKTSKEIWTLNYVLEGGLSWGTGQWRGSRNCTAGSGLLVTNQMVGNKYGQTTLLHAFFVMNASNQKITVCPAFL
jgi:hypothetical protein